MLPHKTISYLYNPSNQQPEELVKNFVIRKKEFRKILRELENADLNILAQHFLIEGQRGTGKTSLLLRLKYEIEAKKIFSDLVVVQFAEEQYNIFDLCRLWENVAEIIEELDGFENITHELDEENELDGYAQTCFGIIEKYLVKNNKRLVLLLDNFGDILDRLSSIEQKRLRDIFHCSSHIQFIASSSRALEHTYKHDKAFFEFFKIIKLDGLNKKDTFSLLEQLTKTSSINIKNIIKNEPYRIEIIRRLTGGIPRTIVLLFEIFLDNSANVFDDLEMILDRVTPLYKHRMDDLATQQQAIMDTIALSWDGISSKEIVNGLKKRGFDSKKVSAQLILLEKNGLTLSKNIDKKNKLYFIKERFFNIWYLMRYGRNKNKTKVLWLVKFLQEWCVGDEIRQRAMRHIESAKENKLHVKGGIMMAEVLAELCQYNSGLQHKILDETKTSLRKNVPNIDKILSKSNMEIFELAHQLYEDKKYDLAIKNYKLLAETGFVTSMNNLAVLYGDKLGNIDKAKKYYKMAIDKEHAISMSNLATLYYNENSHKSESLSLINKSITIEKNSNVILRLAIILLWNNYYIKSVDCIKEILLSSENKLVMSIMINYLTLLLAKKQLHLAYDLFEEFEILKDQFKPIYYTLMKLLKDEYPKEYLRMGDELEETVNEILLKIEEKSLKYEN